MHPEDGFDKMKEKRQGQEEAMKQTQEGKLIPPPRPEWSFEECKRHGSCTRWMNRCICLFDKCPYKHQIPEDTKDAGVPAQFNMFNILTFGKRDPKVNFGKIRKRVALVNEFNTNQSLDGKVLLDTGANEVVRTFSYREWSNIDLGRAGTRKTQVRLAGNKWHGAGMNASGEYMIVPMRQFGIMQESEQKGPWICPIIRCRRELGIKLAWEDEGCYLYGGNLPAPIEAEIINDLPYITRDQFEDIRQALSASHRAGRPSATGYQENHRSWQQVGPRGGRQLFTVRSLCQRSPWTTCRREPYPWYNSNWNHVEASWLPCWNQRNNRSWNYSGEEFTEAAHSE